MWTIEVEFTTGDSFSSERTSDKIGYSWNNLDKAKQSLQLLKIHHNYYKSVEGSKYGRDIKVKKPDNYTSDYSCNIIGDNDELISISVFWHGYFETLHTLTIVTDEKKESDMMVEF